MKNLFIILIVLNCFFIFSQDTTYWYGEYFNNIDLFGEPDFTRNDGDKELNFDWGYSKPVQKIDKEEFSVKWTRKIIVQEDSIYHFKYWSNYIIIHL